MSIKNVYKRINQLFCNHYWDMTFDNCIITTTNGDVFVRFEKLVCRKCGKIRKVNR